MEESLSEQAKQAALTRILQVISGKLGVGVMYTAATLGMVSLIPGLELPGALSAIATGIGVEAMGSIIERVAKGGISDDDIRQQIEFALKQSSLEHLLTRDEFWHGYAQLRKSQRSISNELRAIVELLHNLENSKASGQSVLDGTHYAEGIGNVTGIDVEGPVIFKPGTRSSATGIGNITATRIGGKGKPDQ